MHETMSLKRWTEGDTFDSPEETKKFKMESSSHDMETIRDCVIMPWEDETEVFVFKEDQVVSICSRWELIQKNLCKTTPIRNVDDFIDIIKSYNVIVEKDGRQVKPFWKCLVLSRYFNQLDEYERNNFFEENGVLSTIRHLALELRKFLPRLKVMRSGVTTSTKLHQLQIASILANAFFCTFPKGKADCPSINFNTLYESSSNSIVNYYLEKIKCVMHYFKRIHDKQPTGNLSFHRFCIPDHKFPRWDKTTADLCSLRVDDQGRIEDQEGYLQMDFANRYVGGGVLGRGCVQEEIRFIICPELIAARLFTEGLADNEALLVVGAERYCRYTGYANTFEFAGDYQDATPFDEGRHRKSYLIVLDALYFHHSSEQYRESKILRELKKAYVGFKPIDQAANILPLATGNWGCGAFGGDPQLKTILQLMASSQARRDMLYLTFGNSVLKNQIDELYQILKERSINVGMLYRIIRLYNRERRRNQTVFEFVRDAVGKVERRKPMLKTTPVVKPKPPRFGYDFSREMSMMESATKSQREWPSKENEPEEHHLETENLEEVGEEFRRETTDCLAGSAGTLDAESGAFSESSSVLDAIWFENEIGSGKKGTRVPREVEENSPSLFSEDEKVTLGEGGGFNENSFDSGCTSRRTQDISGNSVHAKKLFQTKITDCFVKK